MTLARFYLNVQFLLGFFIFLLLLEVLVKLTLMVGIDFFLNFYL